MRPCRALVIGLPILLLPLAGCTGQAGNAGSPSATPVQTAPVPAAVVSAHTAFGLSLLRNLSAKDTTSNIFISPASISLALSMLYAGSAGETQAAMAKALSLQGLSAGELDQASRSLLKLLQSDPSVSLAIANSIWMQSGLSVNQAFLSTVSKDYDAKLSSLDFGKPASVGTINHWVSEHTKGKIPSIVSQLDPSTAMLLIDAVYFHGTWTQPFDPSKTHNRSFTTSGGAQEMRPMMDQSGEFDYLENGQFQTVSLPYGKDSRFDMIVVLPKGNLDTLIAALDPSTFSGWLSNLSPQRGDVVLPKFQLQYQQTLNGPLTDLGMGIAFGSGADFSGITKGPLKISQVLHKTFISVDEKGTEAAAVTGVVAPGAAAPNPNAVPFSMVVDHPFLFAIRDSDTGELLFLGRVESLP